MHYNCMMKYLISQINDTSTNVKFKEFIYSENEVRKMGVDVSAPILFDYNSNGKYDIIICKKVGIRNGNKYTYDRLNPIVILDNNQIKEIKGLKSNKIVIYSKNKNLGNGLYAA